MKVSEVLELLKDADPEAEVFVSSDEEGNSYRKADFSFPETALDQYGEWVMADAQDIEDGEYEGWEDEMIAAVVVW